MKLIRIIFLLLILSAGIFGIYHISRYVNVSKTPLGASTEKVRFDIEQGMTGTDVLNALAEKGLVQKDDIRYLKVYMRLNKVPALKEGTYRIPGNLTPSELFTTLQNPENPDIWITIPEGMRKDQIAKLLDEEYSQIEEAVFNKDKFLQLTEDASYIATLGLNVTDLKNLEGFLFPDKYLIPKEATEDYIIKTLVNTFITKTGGTYTYEDIVIASMVEREGLNDLDRPMIADIIKRRMAEGWLLQIDATLNYYYKDWRRQLSTEDIKFDQPYNTYTRTGLPPTPICNPGLSSINATKNPKSNDYYYYLHDSEGRIYYGKTYQEHVLNIQNYLR